MEPENAGPLSDCRVVDLTVGKFHRCLRWLSQLGATVLHASGKWVSENPPVFRPRQVPAQDVNNGENQTPRDAILEKLRGCDVVIESFDHRYLYENSIDFKELRKINPGIILASITGFGQTGVLRHAPACDLVAAATGGQIYLSGASEKAPLKIYGNQSYFCASLYAVIGVLLALREREHTGIGTHLDISLQEVVASTLEQVLVRYVREHRITRRSGNRHLAGVFFTLPCKDGYISISPFLAWETLVALMDADGMAMDLTSPKCRDNAYRQSHMDHIIDVLSNWLRMHTKSWLFETAQLMGLPWAPVQSPAEILACPQLASRRFFSGAPDSMRSRCQEGFPFKCYPHFEQSSHSPQPTEWGGKVSLESFQTPPECNGRAVGSLSGIRVLDFSRVLAGPFATRLLADFGAQVIKVQSTATSTGAEDNNSPQFHATNRNKLGITLNMNRPEAREIALRLVSASDVVLENFSPRVMNNWAMDYSALRKIKEDLIMVRMSAMGQTGPWRNFTAYGPTVQALGGLDFLTAYAPDHPIGLRYAYADIVSGLYAAMAVLAALAQRDKTRAGKLIDLSEYEAVCTTIAETLTVHWPDEEENASIPQHDERELAAPYGCYRCLGDDKWCAIAVFTEAQWHALCLATGRKSWQTCPEFSNFAGRKAHAAVLDVLLRQWTEKMRAEDVAALLQSAGVPAGVVQNAMEVVHDQNLIQRTFFRTIRHPTFGETFSLSPPIRFPENKIEYRPAPLLGEHNQFVYRGILGMDEADYVNGCQKGIFR